jgi:hypothetical protein
MAQSIFSNILHELDEQNVFIALIDSYRLREADKSVIRGTETYSSYARGAEPMTGFRHFLDVGEEQVGLFPL